MLSCVHTCECHRPQRGRVPAYLPTVTHPPVVRLILGHKCGPYLWMQGVGRRKHGGTVFSCHQIRTAFQKAPVTRGHDAEPDNPSLEGNPTGSGWCGQKESQHPHPRPKIWSLKDALGETLQSRQTLLLLKWREAGAAEGVDSGHR